MSMLFFADSVNKIDVSVLRLGELRWLRVGPGKFLICRLKLA